MHVRRDTRHYSPVDTTLLFICYRLVRSGWNRRALAVLCNIFNDNESETGVRSHLGRPDVYEYGKTKSYFIRGIDRSSSKHV